MKFDKWIISAAEHKRMTPREFFEREALHLHKIGVWEKPERCLRCATPGYMLFRIYTRNQKRLVKNDLKHIDFHILIESPGTLIVMVPVTAKNLIINYLKGAIIEWQFG